jgi:hypothetical protein
VYIFRAAFTSHSVFVRASAGTRFLATILSVSLAYEGVHVVGCVEVN